MSDTGSTTQMLELAQTGDLAAKAALWQRFRRLLYEMARDYLDEDSQTGAADTSDVVAEAALRFSAEDALKRIEDGTHLRNWLRTVVHGKAIDQNRREGLRAASPLDDDSQMAPEQLCDLGLAEMEELLRELTDSQHAAALAFLDFGNERVAALALGMTRHHFRGVLSQIREVFGQKLEER